MATVMVRVNQELHESLKALADKDGRSIQSVLAAAIEEYRSRRFWDEVTGYYTQLRSDPDAWKTEQSERTSIEGTLLDNLDRREIWSEDGTVELRESDSPDA